jgi:hypothetical protein
MLRLAKELECREHNRYLKDVDCSKHLGLQKKPSIKQKHHYQAKTKQAGQQGRQANKAGRPTRQAGQQGRQANKAGRLTRQIGWWAGSTDLASSQYFCGSH